MIAYLLTNIHDASTMQKALTSFVRRSNTFNYSKEHMLLELDMIITDLQWSVDRLDSEMSENIEKYRPKTTSEED